MNDLAEHQAITEANDVDTPAFGTSAAIASALTLAACGGGSGGGGGGSDADSTQASRFLMQAGLAANSEDVNWVTILGYGDWLDQSFSAAPSTSNWDWLLAQGYGGADYKYSSYPSDFAIWCRLITAPDHVRQRIALALSEYFVVSANGVPSAWPQFAMAAYWDLLCTHAFGNFRQLLEAITLNPAMGYYLSTRGNRKEDAATGRAPDENYAREIMQLFTIGLYELNLDGTVKTDGSGNPIETYTQDTITNLARVFTGWDLATPDWQLTEPTVMGQPMVFTASRHSTLASTFLGTTIPAGTDGIVALKTALDTLFNHPNVGPFFGKQMIQRLVASNPSQAYVTRVASVFNNNGKGVRGDLKAVFRAILLDPEARAVPTSAQADNGKVREPMLRFIQWARTFKVRSATGTWKIYDLSDPVNGLAQSPLRSPSVFNYFRPGYTPPNTPIANAGLVAPELQIANEPTVAGYLNYMQSVISSGTAWSNNVADVTASYVDELAKAEDASWLVKRINLLMAANQIPADVEARIIAAVGSISATTTTGPLNRVRAAIMLVMACPQYLVLK